MNKAELGKAAMHLATRLPSCRVKGSLLFLTPIGHILRGLGLERSSDPDRFYVWAFFLPLCVPAQQVYFNLGRRLGGGTRTWSVADPPALAALESAVHREALPFLKPLASPRDAALAGKLLDAEHDAATQRAVAYCFARAGDVSQAIREIDRFVAIMAQDNRSWAKAELAEASRLKNLLVRDPAAAQALLQQWENHTLEALGLEHFER
jgi:hypothetical protein